MRILWDVTEQDAGQIRDVVERYQDADIVRDRMKRNLSENRPPLSRHEIWRVPCSPNGPELSKLAYIVGRRQNVALPEPYRSSPA